MAGDLCEPFMNPFGKHPLSFESGGCETRETSEVSGTETPLLTLHNDDQQRPPVINSMFPPGLT
jgi:hypothetical protein